MRELLVVWAGRHDREPWRGLCGDYAERIRRSVPIRDVMVKCKGGESPRRLLEEAVAMRAQLPEPSLLVVLDARGRSMSSERFSQWLGRRRVEFPHPIAFVLGSDVGVAPELRSEADLVLALGPMTFPHELARLMLFEQIYRALAIEQGIKYHRDPF